MQTIYIYICISRSYMYTAAVIRSFLLPARPAAAGWMRQDAGSSIAAVQGQKCTCAHVCMIHDHDCRSGFRHAAAQATAGGATCGGLVWPTVGPGAVGLLFCPGFCPSA